MTPEQSQKYERIDNARFTSGSNDRVFIRKLATQNGWSSEFTLRAVREYRRFLFLAQVAGHPVSPSDVVDQVWHLHLLYTEDYWGTFCPQVIGRAFHHHPNSGEEADASKLRDWYSETLESYQRIFGKAAPADIWPEVNRKVEIDERIHRRVDTAENWVIRKPAFLRQGTADAGAGLRLRPGFALLLLAVALLAGGCSAPTSGDHPIWNMEGPKFLTFFIPFLLVAWTVAFTIRSRAKDSQPPADITPPNLDIHELAYLSDGARRLTQTLVGKLAADGVISIEDKKREVCQVAPLPPQVQGLEREVYDRATGERYREVQQNLVPVFEPVREKLTSLGLLLHPAEWKQAVVIPALITSVPLVFGGIKLYYGFNAGKPVGYLIALSVAGLIAFLLCFRSVFRTRHGERVLSYFQEQFATVRSDLRGFRSGQDTSLIALGIALYGTTVLASTPFSYLDHRLGPQSSGAGGGCGAGCSTGGGGGDGGGGGCGGCGGCGG